jgi:hypothetical protein
LNKNEKIASLVIVILAIIIATVAVYDFVASQAQNSIPPNSFPQEPVVDIIIPTLFRETAAGGINAPLNVTAGDAVQLTVQVYPTISLNVVMQFRYYSLSNNETSSKTNSTIIATFNPSQLDIGADLRGNITMSLGIAQNATAGEYSAVVSAVDLKNATDVWGAIFQINVAQ